MVKKKYLQIFIYNKNVLAKFVNTLIPNNYRNYLELMISRTFYIKLGGRKELIERHATNYKTKSSLAPHGGQ